MSGDWWWGGGFAELKLFLNTFLTDSLPIFPYSIRFFSLFASFMLTYEYYCVTLCAYEKSVVVFVFGTPVGSDSKRSAINYPWYGDILSQFR